MAWPELPRRVHTLLKILCCPGKAERPIKAHHVARSQDIPPAQAAKLLQLLTWAGFTQSRRGAAGGFWLQVPAERLQVRDVIAFFESQSPSHKVKKDSVTRALRKVTDPCRQAFEQLTIAKLSRFRVSHRTIPCKGGNR